MSKLIKSSCLVKAVQELFIRRTDERKGLSDEGTYDSASIHRYYIGTLVKINKECHGD